MIVRELAACTVGYAVRIDPLLPYEGTNENGSTWRTDFVIDHVRKVVLCSRAAFEAIKRGTP